MNRNVAAGFLPDPFPEVGQCVHKLLVHPARPETEADTLADALRGLPIADLIFDRNIKVSARPSDSVAIALRVGVPIFVEEAVLAEAGLLIPDEGDEEAGSAVREDEVEKFKEVAALMGSSNT